MLLTIAWLVYPCKLHCRRRPKPSVIWSKSWTHKLHVRGPTRPAHTQSLGSACYTGEFSPVKRFTCDAVYFTSSRIRLLRLVIHDMSCTSHWNNTLNRPHGTKFDIIIKSFSAKRANHDNFTGVLNFRILASAWIRKQFQVLCTIFFRLTFFGERKT